MHGQHCTSCCCCCWASPAGAQQACCAAQGMGKQVWGVWLNCVCQLCIGLPLAMLLGFRLGYGVEGLLTGLMLGVALQATAYLVILARVDWARLAASIAAAQQTAPEEGPEPA